MAITYETVEKVKGLSGLRLVLVKGLPSPWGLAAKAMMEYKGLKFVCAPQIAGGPNEELVAWSGTNSAPVLAWNDEKPINRWDDILHLIERIAPDKPLLPEDRTLRAQALGFSQELCGELGLGWNIRLGMFSAMIDFWKTSEGIETQAKKYGYRPEDTALADQRVRATLSLFSEQLRTQKSRGSAFLVGEQLTAVDFYWAAFCNLASILDEELAPIQAEARPLLEGVKAKFADDLEPELIRHRDEILGRYYRLPLEM